MKELITHFKPKSPISEAYRGIRTNLLFANVDKKLKTILFTSSTPGEGKTTTMANLAVTMVQGKKKVLVIDCDMRKPRVYKVFEGVKNERGLSELLLEGSEYKSYIKRHPDLDLDIITAGSIPANPSELLISDTMKQLVETVRMDYDYVFFDTPPILPVTDATVMSGYIDGVILVIAAKAVNYEHVNKAKAALLAVDANIVGCVLNRAPVSDKKTYKTYYYYEQKKA